MHRLTVAFVLLTAVFCAETTALGQDFGTPSYLVLQPPAVSADHNPRHGVYPGIPVYVQPQAYSYGWFGVQPRAHTIRSKGYYQDYTQYAR